MNFGGRVCEPNNTWTAFMFLSSPPPPPTFIFWLLFNFSRGQNRESRSSVFLCSETETVATGNSLSLSQMSNPSCSPVNAITQAKEIPAPILTQFPFSIFSNVFLARVARVSVGFRSKKRGTRVTQCYCFLEFQTRAPKNSGTLYPRLSRLLLKDLFVRIIS